MEEKEVQYITPELPPPPVYFKSLTIENVKCFQGEHFIDLSNGKGGPAQWTVILGNNNTGKTTLLKCLAGLEPEMARVPYDKKTFFDPDLGVTLSPSLYSTPYSLLSYSDHPSLIQAELIKLKKEKLGFYLSMDSNIQIVKRFDWSIALRLGDSDLIENHGISRLTNKDIGNLKVDSFNTLRGIDNYENVGHNIFDNDYDSNIENWLLNLSLAIKLGQDKAKYAVDLATSVLISGILPDVHGLEIKSETKGSGYENFVLFKTDYGPIRLHELGYGYQTMIAWILDLVRRMVERYPNSSNPLAEPAIVLVDEIDLHLHPDWQRKIVSHLTKHFPNTQFIVTAHSPLIVQSAEEVNLVILKKENDRVVVDQPNIRSFKGWTVEEIMTDLMQLEGQTMSNTYLRLMTQFDEALDEDNFEKAQSAYNQLDAILHPQSSQRKLLKLQMSALSQPNVV